MARRLALILLTILTAAVVEAQPDTLRRSLTWPQPVTDFEVDKLGNLYLLGANRQIKKINYAFDSVGVFNDVKQYGELHSIDVSNPLKTILFYKDFATIVVLDRFMQVRTTVDLRRANMLQVTAVAQSYDNNIWVYDELQARLIKIDEEGKKLEESADLRQVVDAPVPVAHELIDHERNVFLVDSTLGIYVLDYFGAMQKHLRQPGVKIAGGAEKQLVVVKDGKLGFYDLRRPELTEYPLPVSVQQIRKVRVYNNTVFILYANGVVSEYQPLRRN